jgi:hypothetical protein
MREDPIVEEVHRIREKLAAEFNFDVKRIFADFRKRQVALGSRLVSPINRREPEVIREQESPGRNSADRTGAVY